MFMGAPSWVRLLSTSASVRASASDAGSLAAPRPPAATREMPVRYNVDPVLKLLLPDVQLPEVPLIAEMTNGSLPSTAAAEALAGPLAHAVGPGPGHSAGRSAIQVPV